jgi:hypothetical protein
VAPAARDWLGEARSITHDIPRVGAALLHAEQGRRFNVRAVGTANVGPGLRQGLEALEHSAIAIRTLFRALVDATQDLAWPGDEEAGSLLLEVAQTFRDMAAGVDAFGQLVRNEADAVERMTSADVRALHEALEGLREARARSDRRLAEPSAPELLELHAAVLSTVKRLQAELDLDERLRRQVRLLRPPRPRPPRTRGPGSGDRPATPEPTPDAETQLLPRHPRDPRDKRR